MNKLPDTICVREYRTSPTNTELKVVPIQVDEKTAKYVKIDALVEWLEKWKETLYGQDTSDIVLAEHAMLVTIIDKLTEI